MRRFAGSPRGTPAPSRLCATIKHVMRPISRPQPSGGIRDRRLWPGVLGAAQYRLGDYQAAQVAIAQALSLDKSDALAYFLMGSTLVRLGQTTAAERQFAEAARLDPRFSRHE